MSTLRTRTFVMLASCSLLIGACDYEDKVRKALSDRKKDQRAGKVDKDPQGQPLSSEPREQEPNNTRAQASSIMLGKELRSVLAELPAQSDVDWYVLRAGEPGLFELTVDAKSEDLDLIAVIDIGKEQLEYNLGGAGEAEVIPIVSLGVDDVVVRIEAKHGAGEYALRFKKRLSAGAIEAEPNDLREFAQLVKLPGELQGFYDRPGDVDYFEFDLSQTSAGAVYQLEVSALDEVGQRVMLFRDGQVEPMLEQDIGPGQSFRIPNMGLSGGLGGLWLGLAASNDGFSREKPYRLALVPHPPTNPGQVLEIEPNDTPPQEPTVELLDKPVELLGYLHREDDRDVFLVRLPQASTPTPVAAPVKAPGEEPSSENEALMGALGGDSASASALAGLPEFAPKVRPEHLLELVVTPRAKDTVLGVVMQTGAAARVEQRALRAGESVSLCHMPLAAGDYPFTIQPVRLGERAGGFDYSVRLMDHAASVSEGIEIEPNNTRGEPDRVELGGSIGGFIATGADEDVYFFELPGAVDGPFEKIEVSLGAHPLDLEFSLFDVDGASLGSAQRAGKGGVEKLAISLPPGRYFASVRSRNGATCEPYSLSVKKVNSK